MMFDTEQIGAATAGQIVRVGGIGPVMTDSRSFPRGAWFVALSGDRFDGHQFLAQVASAGATGVVVSRLVPDLGVGQVVVSDTVRAFQDLGRAARIRFSGPVIGVTGSAGKTTSRALVALAVSPLGTVHQTTGNLNNHLGVPMTLLAAPDPCAALVLEMGTSSPGEIAFLAEISQPNVRLIVNVGAAHLEELGGLDGVAREKGQLFDTARPGDWVCRNLDDGRIATMPLPRGINQVTYGWAEQALIRLMDARIDPVAWSTSARFSTPNGEVDVRLPAPGLHLAHNAAGALAVAFALGVDLGLAAAAMSRYEPVGMRMRPEQLPDFPEVLFLNDTYNANPTSMEASLRVLASLPGRRFAVLGDMLELGPEEGAWHTDVVRFAESLGLDCIYLCGDRMGAVKRARSTQFESEPAAIAERLRHVLKAGDRVLLKGSRGARVERVLESLRGTAGESH